MAQSACPPAQQLARDAVDAVDAALNRPAFLTRINTLFTQQVAAALGDAHAQRDKAERERDHLGRDRTKLLALLATQYPAWWGADPKAPGWKVLTLELPVSPHGQVSFHIAPGDLDLFTAPINAVIAPDGPAWDGHSDQEKSNRLYAVALMHANSRHAGPAAALPPAWTKEKP